MSFYVTIETKYLPISKLQQVLSDTASLRKRMERVYMLRSLINDLFLSSKGFFLPELKRFPGVLVSIAKYQILQKNPLSDIIYLGLVDNCSPPRYSELHAPRHGKYSPR